ncbi:unnamed protein product [Lactuca saligna]|uniref:Uncharacterized protein n=1 Tax=Lactuca saligna TaxID=75948 RepID=A0AA35VWB3_LACSI|nr:unnamed protein product [Lactuca saligna]
MTPFQASKSSHAFDIKTKIYQKDNFKPVETEMSESEDVRIEMHSNQSEPADNVNHGYAREWEFCIQQYETVQISERKRKMEKVPPLLLKGEKGARNRQCYEPAVISLGPYHHKRDDLVAAEKYKLITLEEYCLICKNTMDSLYNKVFEVVQDARKCYVDGSTDEYNDEQFTGMMLRDGCFVLFFIYCIATEPNTMLMLNIEYLGTSGFLHIVGDILLLENQIPFIVLQVLLDMQFPEDRGERILNEFFNYLNYGKITTKKKKVLEMKQPLHLLELYRSHFISLGVHQKNTSGIWNYVKRNQSFPSVNELKAKGIFLKRTNVDDESYNEDINFHSYCCYGELEVVQRAVYENSKAIYLNMIAYESCPYNPNDLRVSTYIRLMKSLVVHHDDVKELRDNNILHHSFRRDEEVVKMYDEIDVPLVNVHVFNQLRRGIENHCNNKYKTWAAELITIYFSTPWKTVSLGVAILGLILTVIKM